MKVKLILLLIVLLLLPNIMGVSFTSTYLENNILYIQEGCKTYEIGLQNTKSNEVIINIIINSDYDIINPNNIKEILLPEENKKVSFEICVDNLEKSETYNINIDYSVSESQYQNGMIILGESINKHFIVIKEKLPEIISPQNPVTSNNRGSGNSGENIITRKEINKTANIINLSKNISKINITKNITNEDKIWENIIQNITNDNVTINQTKKETKSKDNLLVIIIFIIAIIIIIINYIIYIIRIKGEKYKI